MTVAKVYTEGNVPLKVWTDSLEQGALEQALHLTYLPFAFKQAAVMPDGHQGYGMPIGGVLAARNVVVPYAVGVDIGCGVRAWKTGLKVEEFMPKRDEVMNLIQKTIPVGFHKHSVPSPLSWVEGSVPPSYDIPVVNREYENSLVSLGTLGGGNHFIEVQADEDDNVWAMIHSGSRNLGKQVCDHYNKIAEELNSRWHTKVPKEWQLAFLPMDSTEGQHYLMEMTLCLTFAKANRKHMMEAVDLALMSAGLSTISPDPIDVHHNYAAKESWCGTCNSNRDSDSPLAARLLDDPVVSRVQGFLSGYRLSRHSCGGLLLRGATSGLKLSPSQVGALEQMSLVLPNYFSECELTHNHFESFGLCECADPVLFDESCYNSSNKFGLGYAHLFGVERDVRRLDRVLGSIFYGASSYDLDCQVHLHKTTPIIVHRKGAVKAVGTVLIPGSMGSHSYIGKGLESPESFKSCSHGAGRAMGRRAAIKAIEESDVLEEMKAADIGLYVSNSKGVAAESRQSYHDIDVVMANQSDLVEIMTKLRPLAVIKDVK